MTDILRSTIYIVVILGLLVLSILSVVGLVYITQFAFKSKDMGKDQKCIKLSSFKMKLARLTVVLLWIQIGLMVLGALAGALAGNGRRVRRILRRR